MRFSEWLKGKDHVNAVGGEIADSTGLVRGPKAWNQKGQDCYEIASAVARRFGYEPVSANEIGSILDQYKRWWASKNVKWIKAPQPIPPKPGKANFVVRVGDDFRHHVSFELKGKEYNYGAASPDGFNILFRIGLKPDDQMSSRLSSS